MDNNLFLQCLRELSLEEGKACIREHAEGLTEPDYVAIGELIAEEALHLRDTNPSASFKLAELLIFFGDYFHHIPSHALGLKAKGDALEYVGQYQAALECLDAAGEEFLSLEDTVNWARTRIAWIVSRAWQGYPQEALEKAAHARDLLLQHGEEYWACVVDHNTAVVYSQIGQYQKALELYERMLAIYPTVTNQSEIVIKRAIALAEMNQGRNLAWQGNFEAAYRLLKQAQRSFIALEQTGLTMNAEFNLAELDYAQGYYGSALRHHYQIRDSLIQNSFNVPELLASIELRMAVCLVKLNRAYEACRLADDAVKVYRQLGTSLIVGDALREYATTLIASDRSEEALAALNEAWTLFSQSGFDHHAYTTRLQQVELLLQMGSVEEAYDQAHTIKEYFDTHGAVLRSVRASLVMIEALIEIVQRTRVKNQKEQLMFLREARLLCEQATNLARQHNLQEQAYQSRHLLGRLAIIQGDQEEAFEHYGAAIAQIESMLDDLVYDLSPSFLHTTWTIYEEMIVLCLQQARAEHAFSYLERARSMALRQYLNKKASQSESALQAKSATVLRMQHELEEWKERYHKYSTQLVDSDISMPLIFDREAIQSELKRCETKINEMFERLHLQQLDTRSVHLNGKRETRSVPYVDVAQLRQHLSPDQLLLAYFLYKGRLLVFALTTEHLIVHENPDGAAQLEQLLPFLHAHLDIRGWPDTRRPPQTTIRRLLNKLYDLLIAPVSALLPAPSGYLTIVPYGSLHKLPFHALYDGSQFLIERFQVNYLPASSILIHIHRSTQNGHTREKEIPIKPPIVFGYSANGQLQRALDEAKIVAKLLNGNCHLEEEATIAHLIEQAPGSPIIHLATHGKSRLDSPNFSFVRLADGQLNAIDAFSLNLEGCELVTLSGCETGLALSSGGDEQLGLGRAFMAAGCSSLVMSLWSVEDNATNELMQLFYQYLLSGKSKVEALRAAQCSLLHQTSPIYAHPYFWAAFRLVGDIGPLQFETEPLKK